MKTEANAKLVIIYVNSTDRYHGWPLYQAIIQLCQQQGIAGASVMRCVEGYGAHHRLHTTRLLELSENLPVRIEIVDLKEKIDSFLEPLSQMIDEGLVTISDVHILRFSPEKKV